MPDDTQNPQPEQPGTQIPLSNAIATTKPKGKMKRIIIIAIVALVVLGLGGATAWALQQKSKTAQSLQDARSKTSELDGQVATLKNDVESRKETTGEANIDKSGFQSVFLKSGQVYFGKITSISETQMVLENIYYLRNNSGGTGIAPGTSGEISLVKLGNEIHGPQDKMFIERKEVEFWENLKNDGDVAKAIAEYEKHNP